MRELVITFIAGLFFILALFIRDFKTDFSVSKSQYEQQIPCVALNDAILKYSKKYGIPLNIAYNVARLETGYLGPLHFNYSHTQTSSVGAVGPMQIMPKTANWIRPKYGKGKVNSKELLSNIDMNVETSMMLLRNRYELRKNWKIVLGEYNTGYPIVNDYAVKGVTLNPVNYMIKPDID